MLYITLIPPSGVTLSARLEMDYMCEKKRYQWNYVVVVWHFVTVVGDGTRK